MRTLDVLDVERQNKERTVHTRTRTKGMKGAVFSTALCKRAAVNVLRV